MALVTATNKFKAFFGDQYLDEISSRDLTRWVAHERRRGIKDRTLRLWPQQFNKVCQHAKRLGYYVPDYEWGDWNIKDRPIRYLTDTEVAYAAFVKNERFKQTIDLLDQPDRPKLKIVK